MFYLLYVAKVYFFSFQEEICITIVHYFVEKELIFSHLEILQSITLCSSIF